MSWGDPFDKFYKDDEDGVRQASLIEQGLIPGTLVSYGKLGSDKALHIWEFPDFKADCHVIMPGVGIVLAVDCESDPVDDWLMLFINTPSRKMFGWLPTKLVAKIE
mgnify:CR=1 FL=1